MSCFSWLESSERQKLTIARYEKSISSARKVVSLVDGLGKVN